MLLFLLFLVDPKASRVSLGVQDKPVVVDKIPGKVPEKSVPFVEGHRDGIRIVPGLIDLVETKGSKAVPANGPCHLVSPGLVFPNPERLVSVGIAAVSAAAIATALVFVSRGLDPKDIAVVVLATTINGIYDSFRFVFLLVVVSGCGFNGIKYPATVFAAVGIGLRQVGKALQEGRGSHSRDQNEFHMVLVSNLVHQRQCLCRDDPPHSSRTWWEFQERLFWLAVRLFWIVDQCPVEIRKDNLDGIGIRLGCIR